MVDSHGSDQSGAPDLPTDVVLSASGVWQSGATEQRTEALSAYLDQAAAMSPIQVAAARARAMLHLEPGRRVLDMGCGTGVALLDLAAAVAPGGAVTGVDHADDLLAAARQRLDRLAPAAAVDLRLGDAEALPFPDASFDAAYISRVLIHLHDPNRALQEARRVVKPGGWVAAIEPDFDGMRIDHIDPEAAQFLVAAHSAGIRNPSMGIELFRRFAEAGFGERTITWLTELESTYDPEATSAYRQLADQAVDAGWLTRERANAAVDYLVEAGERGTFISYSTLMIVAGRVPSTAALP